jgi:hypothetical protein
MVEMNVSNMSPQRLARRAAGLRIVDVAARSGCSCATVGHYEVARDASHRGTKAILDPIYESFAFLGGGGKSARELGDTEVTLVGSHTALVGESSSGDRRSDIETLIENSPMPATAVKSR